MIIKEKPMKQMDLQRQRREGDVIYSIIIITLFLFVEGCNKPRGLYYESIILNKDTIEVVYTPALMETPIGFEHHHLKSYVFKKADTVYLSKCDYLEISTCLKKFKKIIKHVNCDSRYYIKYGNIDIFLRENPLYSCENEKTPFSKNEHALYVLLDKCQFFNHIPPEELEWNALIKKIGIPKDYEYIPLYDTTNTTYYYWQKQNGNNGFLKTVLIYR